MVSKIEHALVAQYNKCVREEYFKTMHVSKVFDEKSVNFLRLTELNLLNHYIVELTEKGGDIRALAGKTFQNKQDATLFFGRCSNIQSTMIAATPIQSKL